jgi:translation initiation factor 4G
MAMPMSPRVPPIGVAQAAPQTPQSPHPALPAGNRSSFIAKRPILIKNSAGEKIDLADLTKKAPPKQEDSSAPSRKEEAERRPVSIRLETVDAHKKRMEEEKLKDKDRFKMDDDLAKVKAKRDAEARERAKRDQEEKERRQREQEEAEQKKLEEERAKRGAEDAEKERIKREEEEREREKERLKKLEEEAAERARVEAEEKEKARLAEIEAKKKEGEEAAKRKAEEEAKRKEEEEARRKEEAKREEEAARKAAEEAARLEAEAKQKAQEEEEAKRLKEKEEQEAAVAAAAPATDSASQASTPHGSTSAYASPARSVTSLPPKSALPASLDPKRRPIPGRLNLSSTTSANLPQPLPSALASARIIEDIGKVSYPEGIKAPSSELNVNASSGKFRWVSSHRLAIVILTPHRYDRDFLMQFMKVCKEKPDDMPSLDAIGLEPSEQQGSFPGRRARPSMPAATSTRGPMGLGLSGPAGAPFGGKSFGGGGMGQFQAPRSSEERFAAASIPRAVSGAVQFPRQALGRTNSTSGPPIQGAPGRRETLQRPQSGRGSKRNDSKAGQPPSGMHNLISAEPDLHHAENSWSTQRRPAAQDPNSPEFIDRKVKALLNKLTMEKFDPISEQILEWANRSVNEVDGRTLIQVIRLVFEKATDEATWSEMYARLCRFLMERISQDVRDEGIKNADGKPIAGGNLFRKYLLNRCQEDFERGWSAREAAMLAAASKAEDDKAVAAAAEKAGSGEEVLYSDEYYASQKAKRRGLGLVKFIGELFKLQMLTERIMHECIKKLLSNVENPEEEEIESLCKLLATVGQALDTPKARNHMDIYFGRMQELANSGQISSRIQYMLIVSKCSFREVWYVNVALGYHRATDKEVGLKNTSSRSHHHCRSTSKGKRARITRQFQLTGAFRPNETVKSPKERQL